MALHFIGFRGDEYHRACRVFGAPDFVHPRFDARSTQEAAPGDQFIFADRDAPADVFTAPRDRWSWDDSRRF